MSHISPLRGSGKLFLIRFVQHHVSFRLAEIQALSELEGIPIEIVDYREDSPYCLVFIASFEDAKRLVSRAILTKAIWEFLGEADSYEALHAQLRQDIKQQSQVLSSAEEGEQSQSRSKPSLRVGKIDWHGDKSWKFSVDAYLGRRTMAEQRQIIETFSYIPLTGPINLKSPQQEFRVFEEYTHHLSNELKRVFLTRHVGETSRDVMQKYDLKKRCYISTTSMDAELALVTANLALAAQGKLMYDPFAGTGGFMISCSHFGAQTWGSDIDARSLRGKEKGKNVLANFESYDIVRGFGDLLICDLTNSPVRLFPWLDGIVCDPPYGVREGLSVLGLRPGKEFRDENGEVIKQQRYEEKDFIPPRKPYSFLRLLDDILAFAAATLVEHGRLSMWIPSENSEVPPADAGAAKSDVAGEGSPKQLDLPAHPALEVVSVCTQDFNRWSRRLVTYRKRPSRDVQAAELEAWERRRAEKAVGVGSTADELNEFRKRYFEGFRKDVT